MQLMISPSIKLIFTAFLLVIVSVNTNSQTITHDDFKTIIPSLQKEDFKEAFKKTNELLSSTQNDSSDLRGIITYMNIYSAAGMVTLDQMTLADFSKNADKYVGYYVVMSAHPCIDSSTKGYNSLQFVTTEKGELQGMTITSNRAKTNILCFEYFDYSDPISPADFIGKNVRCGGILKSVEISKSKIWIARLHISDAFARAL